MAGSRLEGIGTIFSRVTGMIRAGGTKWEDRPLWYDVYAAFPPKYEPRCDRDVPKDLTIRKLIYPEDEIRAEFYKKYGSPGFIDMTDNETPTVSEKFLKKYIELAKSDPNKDAEEVFELTANSLSNEGVLRTKGSTEKSPGTTHQPAQPGTNV